MRHSFEVINQVYRVLEGEPMTDKELEETFLHTFRNDIEGIAVLHLRQGLPLDLTYKPKFVRAMKRIEKSNTFSKQTLYDFAELQDMELSDIAKDLESRGLECSSTVTNVLVDLLSFLALVCASKYEPLQEWIATQGNLLDKFNKEYYEFELVVDRQRLGALSSKSKEVVIESTGINASFSKELFRELSKIL